MYGYDLRYQLYGYDASATLNDAATLNDTTRNDATHDDLATPTTTTRPTLNVNADWRAQPSLPVLFQNPKPATAMNSTLFGDQR